MTDIEKLVIMLIVVVIIASIEYARNKEEKEHEESYDYLDHVKDYYRNCYIYLSDVLESHKKEKWVKDVQKELNEEREKKLKSLKVLFPQKNEHIIDYDIKYETTSIVFNGKFIDLERQKREPQ